MRKNLLITTLLLIMVSSLVSVEYPFIEGYFYPKQIAVCFDNDIVQSKGGVIEYQMENGVLTTGITSFDALSRRYDFVDLIQKYPDVVDKDWNDKGRYPRNVYQIILARNDNIENALTDLMQDDNILFAEYETIYKRRFIPNDPLYPDQWHIPQLECEEAWDYGMGSEEIVVGIVDSGVHWTHEDLHDNIWVNQAELDAGMTINWNTGSVSGGNGIDDDGNGKVDDVLGWNFYDNNNNTNQTTADNDHGTHVAGCAAAVGNNNIGVIGTAPNVKILVSRHAGSAPTESIYYGNSGIYYCADTGADVINCSWGGPGGGYQANQAVNYARDHGALVVAAAGNDDTQHGSGYSDYPADADNALCVAATDQNDVKTYFSDYGYPIDVSAPGIDIKSTVIGGTGYASYQGTSMASPIVAGVAALVKSFHPTLTPMQLRQRIMDTTDFIDDVSGNESYAGLLGTGRVNAFTASMYDVIPRLSIVSYELTEVDGDGDGIPNPGESMDLTMMLQNEIFSGGFWAAAQDVNITFSTDLEGAEIEAGTETIHLDYIGQASFASTENSPVRIITDQYMNELDIPINIVIEANPSASYPYHKEYQILAHMSLEQAGWPYEMTGETTSSPLIVDLNNSGDNEVVFADNEGLVHALESDGTTELEGFPYNFENSNSSIGAALAVGNINGDDFLEIVVANNSGKIFALGQGGNLLFTYDALGQIKSNPIIADVDGEGTNKIIAFTFTAAKAIILNGDGSTYGNFPITLNGGVISSSAVGDLNNDGTLDLIAVATNGDVFAISTATGEELGGWPYSLGMGSWNGPIIANVTGDNDPEILVGTLNGKLIILNNDGTLQMEKNVGGQIKSSVVTADLDTDGDQDIVFVKSDGMLYVIDAEGNDINGNFPYPINAQSESTPILADMDGNGSLDIIFGDQDGYLHAIDVDGSEIGNFPTFVQTGIKVSPAIGDTDGDGDPEIAVSNHSSLLLIDYKRNIGEVAWGCFKRNAERNGNSYFPSLEGEESGISHIITSIGKNYPNPFNPTTTINYSISENSPVNLEIYNIKGQRVKTLVNQAQKAGYHSVVWNGTDNNAQPVSSGIYFYKLKAAKYNGIKKMILMK